MFHVSQFWRRELHATMSRVLGDRNDIDLSDINVDDFCRSVVLNPRQFDVVCTSNLFGDVISEVRFTEYRNDKRRTRKKSITVQTQKMPSLEVSLTTRLKTNTSPFPFLHFFCWCGTRFSRALLALHGYHRHRSLLHSVSLFTALPMSITHLRTSSRT